MSDYYNFEIITFMDGSACVQYQDHGDNAEAIKPTYQKLFSTIERAQAFTEDLK
jgi:hypothetical protein